MKKEFSTSWNSSTQPRKQRKYIAKAPLHLKRKLLSVNLSKELRQKHKVRNIVIKKGDKVKIMRGKFAKKTGKVETVKIKLQKVYIEGIFAKKLDGSKVNVPLRASNLQIIELNLEDKKRASKLGVNAEKTKETKKEDSESIKSETKEKK